MSELVALLAEALAKLKDKVDAIVIPEAIKGDKGDKGEQGIAGKDGKDGKDGNNGIDGKDGAKGDKGDQGERGADGIDGKDGKDGLNGRDGVDGKDGKDGLNGRNGVDGLSIKGDKGDKGDIPKHEWKGTSLRFELPNGKWGKYVDLEGRAGLGGHFMANANSGDVLSRYPSTDNAIVRYDGINGKEVITSLASISDLGLLSTPNIYTDSVQFNLTGTTLAPSVGLMRWNEVEGGLDVTMKGGNVTLQVGQELMQRIYNNTGTALTDGQVVIVTGAQGQRLTVALALANNDFNSATILGVVTEPIPNNTEGFVTVYGKVNGVNTKDYADGEILWLSPTIAGSFTNVKPAAPNHLVQIGYVVKGGSVGAGSIYVHVQNGYELDELHNVLITSPTNGQTIVYDSATQLWKNGAGGSGGASALADLTDVDLAGLATDDLLVYDGIQWVNKTQEAAIYAVDGGTFN